VALRCPGLSSAVSWPTRGVGYGTNDSKASDDGRRTWRIPPDCPGHAPATTGHDPVDYVWGLPPNTLGMRSGERVAGLKDALQSKVLLTVMRAKMGYGHARLLAE
jgi:hypothetical protein